MMKLSGIMKLRLVITTMFLILSTSILISVWIVTVNTDAETDFYEKLTQEDENDLIRIFAEYPDTGTDGILATVGYMMFFVTIVLGFLTWKVWVIKEIK